MSKGREIGDDMAMLHEHVRIGCISNYSSTSQLLSIPMPLLVISNQCLLCCNMPWEYAMQGDAI